MHFSKYVVCAFCGRVISAPTISIRIIIIYVYDVDLLTELHTEISLGKMLLKQLVETLLNNF